MRSPRCGRHKPTCSNCASTTSRARCARSPHRRKYRWRRSCAAASRSSRPRKSTPPFRTSAPSTSGPDATVCCSKPPPRVSGDFLHIQIGLQELAVPGGAVLAPAGTPVVDAGAWSRIEEEKALQDFAQLVAVAHNAGAFTQPLLRRRIEQCAAALSLHNRWQDLLRLTDGISAKSENVPTNVLFLRDVALQRTQRLEEARVLLADLASSPVLSRRN